MEELHAVSVKVWSFKDLLFCLWCPFVNWFICSWLFIHPFIHLSVLNWQFWVCLDCQTVANSLRKPHFVSLHCSFDPKMTQERFPQRSSWLLLVLGCHLAKSQFQRKGKLHSCAKQHQTGVRICESLLSQSRHKPTFSSMQHLAHSEREDWGCDTSQQVWTGTHEIQTKSFCFNVCLSMHGWKTGCKPFQKCSETCRCHQKTHCIIATLWQNVSPVSNASLSEKNEDLTCDFFTSFINTSFCVCASSMLAWNVMVIPHLQCAHQGHHREHVSTQGTAWIGTKAQQWTELS